MKKLIFILLIGLTSVTSTADITNIVNIASLVTCGTGTIDGWTVAGIDSYSDRTSIRINAAGEFITSPDYEVNIRKVILHVKSSSQAGRRLALFLYTGDDFALDESLTCDYSPTKDTYVPRSVIIPPTYSVSRFKIALDDPNNGDTGWGISYLAVITADPPEFASPKSVTVDSIHATNARIRWDHNDLVASNLVSISTVTKHAESFSVRASYDFDLCSNSGTSDTQDRSQDLAEKYPEFSAEKIYYPAQSQGILKVSTGSANGRLTHAGYDRYKGMGLEIVAKRYPTDTNCSKISAFYLDTDQQPQEIGSVIISENFTTNRISLAGTPDGAAISIGNLDGVKSNRRFFIDRIAFLNDYTPESLSTNTVMTVIASKRDRCRINGLTKMTPYLVSVTAIDQYGNSAKPSSLQSFTTAGKDGPMMLRFR